MATYHQNSSDEAYYRQNSMDEVDEQLRSLAEAYEKALPEEHRRLLAAISSQHYEDSGAPRQVQYIDEAAAIASLQLRVALLKQELDEGSDIIFYGGIFRYLGATERTARSAAFKVEVDGIWNKVLAEFLRIFRLQRDSFHSQRAQMAPPTQPLMGVGQHRVASAPTAAAPPKKSEQEQRRSAREWAEQLPKYPAPRTHRSPNHRHVQAPSHTRDTHTRDTHTRAAPAPAPTPTSASAPAPAPAPTPAPTPVHAPVPGGSLSLRSLQAPCPRHSHSYAYAYAYGPQHPQHPPLCICIPPHWYCMHALCWCGGSGRGGDRGGGGGG
jgi:hypothetical protein